MSEPRADLVYGWNAIGSYLGISADAARWLGRNGGLPFFKLSKQKVGALRSQLDKWVADRAAQPIVRAAA